MSIVIKNTALNLKIFGVMLLGFVFMYESRGIHNHLISGFLFMFGVSLFIAAALTQTVRMQNSINKM